MIESDARLGKRVRRSLERKKARVLFFASKSKLTSRFFRSIGEFLSPVRFETDYEVSS